MNDSTTKKASASKIILTSIISLLIFLIGFLGGFFVNNFVLSNDEYMIKWMLETVKKQYYQDYTDEQFIEAFANGLKVSGMIDKYSDFYTPEELAIIIEQNKGNQVGFGVSINDITDTMNNKIGGVYVVQSKGNSPAEKAGIKAGDVFISINGTDVSKMNTTKLIEVMAQYGENDEVNFVMGRGYFNGDDSKKEELSFKIKKAKYVENNVYYESLNEKTAMITLTSFTGQAYSQFKNAMNQYKTEGKENLIIDLRGNGGGNIDILVDISQHLISADDKALILKARYKKNKTEDFKTSENFYSNYTFKNMKVMIDSGTASASEALVLALLDYKSIDENDIYGSKSYGKGIMQTTIPNVFKSYAIKLTTATVHSPLTDRCIHDIGIFPPESNTVDSKHVNFPYVRENDWELNEILKKIK